MKGFVKNIYTAFRRPGQKARLCLHTAEQSSVKPQCCVYFAWDSGFLQLHYTGAV